MKRKGFTLVELLIVIAILGAPAAMMSLSSGKSTSAAKAAAIRNNIASARNAGMLYYSVNMNSTSATTVAFSDTTLADYVDIDNFSSTNTKYKAKGTNGLANASDWAIYCDFNGEADAADIATNLKGSPMFKNVAFADEAYHFKLNVLDGKAALAEFPTD